MSNKILIVGGAAGGASAAARLRRLDETAEIILFEKGAHIAPASCGIPYYLGGVVRDADVLLPDDPTAFKIEFNVDDRIHHEVMQIDRKQKTVTVRRTGTDTDTGTDTGVGTSSADANKNAANASSNDTTAVADIANIGSPGETYTETYDKLILATGGTAIKPDIPGIDNPGVFTVRTVEDMYQIKAFIDNEHPASAIVYGANLIGTEIADNLHKSGLSVTIAEQKNQHIGGLDYDIACEVYQYLSTQGIEVLQDTELSAVDEEGGKRSVTLSGNKRSTDLLIIAAGIEPETRLAESAGIETGTSGGIKVNEYMQTSAPDIYAVGDAVETQESADGAKALSLRPPSRNPHEPLSPCPAAAYYPNAGAAARQARTAADHISGLYSAYAGAQGAQVVKILDMTAATTGLTEADASVSAIDYEKSFTNSSSHAGFYPSAVDMTIKLIFEKNTGKILGAQIVGYEGADKRIDVITTAIRLGATADDLTNLDLAYSAPYSTPKDPVNIAGSVAQNILTGKVKVFHWHDVAKLPKDGSVSLLDVRSKLEYANGTIEGFKNISLGHIRKSLGEIDKTKPVYITCQTGHRGYIASRILTGNGYDCYNLSGGHKLYESITSAPTATLATPAPNTSPVIPAKAGISAPTATPVPATNTPSPVIASEAKQSSVPAAAQREASITKTGKVIQVNAEGLQCPGPIIKLSAALKDIETGDTIEISATDAAFPGDAESFCRRTGNEFQGVTSKGGVSVATITKGTAPAPGASGTPGALYASNANGKNFIVFSGDLDKAIASFIMANASAALGRDVSMFFTFWGLNLLRRPEKVPVKKSFIPKMFAAMMPRGSRKLPLSKMNFGGMGAKMIRKVMNDNNISSLEDLMSTARENGVKFVACGMSMDVMGITEAELIEGVTIGGAASMLAHAEESDMSLFI